MVEQIKNSFVTKILGIMYVLALTGYVFVDKGIPAITGKSPGHELANQVKMNSSDIDAIKTDIRELRAGVQELKEGQATRNEAINGLRGDIADLKSLMGEFRKELIAHVERGK